MMACQRLAWGYWTVFGAVAIPLAVLSCTSTGQLSTQGQLFCALASPSGPIVSAIVTATPDPRAVLAEGTAATIVQAICAAAGGVPVSPPPNPAAAPTVAVDVHKITG